jgi:hypothetical protein
MEILTHWAETIQLLKKLGFVELPDDPDKLENPALELHQIWFTPDHLVYIEQEMLRQRLVVVLYDGPNYGFSVWIQKDIACGWVRLPFAWSEISEGWLTHLKKAFYEEGFKK